MNEKLTVGELVYKISGDIDNLKTELKKAEAEVGKLTGSMEKNIVAGNRMTKTIGGLSNVLKGFLALAIVDRAASFLTDFLRQSSAAASDLNETLTKTGVLFGGEAQDIITFAQNAAREMGISRQAALDAAGTFAVFAKSAGLAGDDLTTFSTDLVKLSSDLASFYNTSPEDAIVAIGAALRGETEPIRRYGVLLDDASLRQEAFRQGLITTTKDALKPQQRVLAAQALILRQTNDAQGDFARTADGVANSQRTAAAETRDFQAAIGQALLPTTATLIEEYRQMLIGANDAASGMRIFGQAIFGGAKMIIGTTKALFGMGQALVATAKTTWGFQKLYFTAMGNVVKSTLNAGKAVLKLFSGDFEGAVEAAKGALDFSKTKDEFASFASSVKSEWGAVNDTLVSAGDDIIEAYNPAAYDDALQRFQQSAAAAGDASKGLGEDLNGPGGVSDGAKKAAEAVEQLQGKVVSLIDASKNAARVLQDDLNAAFKQFSTDIASNVQETVEGAAQIFVDAEQRIKDLKAQLREADDGDARKEIRTEIKAQEEILDAREDFEERQSERIAAIRTKLAEVGIDATQAGLDKVLELRSLESEIEEQRRLASLDEFTRFEQTQAKQLAVLTDSFITEVSLIKTKIETQKNYEADLTAFLASEDSKRLDQTDAWAAATISKYAEVADSLRSLMSTQARIGELTVPSLTGNTSNAARAASFATQPGASSSTTNNTNITAPVNVGGERIQNLNPKELSAILGFELGKFIR